MATVTVEVEDLAAASRTLSRSIADRTFDRVDAALQPLYFLGGMAGDDPAPLHWAAALGRCTEPPSTTAPRRPRSGPPRTSSTPAVPGDWDVRPASNGEGTVYIDPLRRGRQIRIMKPYPAGSRPDPSTDGPYAVISQNGFTVKVPLAENPVLP